MQVERQICGNREQTSQDKTGERAARKTPTGDTLREAKLAHPLEKKTPTNPKQQRQKGNIELKFWIKVLLSPLGSAK